MHQCNPAFSSVLTCVVLLLAACKDGDKLMWEPFRCSAECMNNALTNDKEGEEKKEDMWRHGYDFITRFIRSDDF